MPTRVMDEVATTLDVCRALDMLADRVGRTLGPSRAAFPELMVHPERLENDMRMLPRKLRNTALLFRLERDCRAGRHLSL